jgi:protein TonB
MKIGLCIGIVCAVLVHAGVILFGGLIFNPEKKDAGKVQQVDLLGDASPEPEKEKKPEPKPEPKEAIETASEPVPDASEIVKNLELSAAADAPALDAASLSAIEAALDGRTGGGGAFAESMSFASGGRIGGLGKAGVQDQSLESAFDLSEIDQKPRVLFQASPIYPSEARSKKLEGVVTVIFVVDPGGKVENPRVEKSTDNAFDRPAIDAVKRWKFEPAVKGGQRVPCRMRVPIRFQPS